MRLIRVPRQKPPKKRKNAAVDASQFETAVCFSTGTAKAIDLVDTTPVRTGGGAGEHRPSIFLRVDNLSNVDYSIKMICNRDKLLRCQEIVFQLLQFRKFSQEEDRRTPQARGSNPPGDTPKIMVCHSPHTERRLRAW